MSGHAAGADAPITVGELRKFLTRRLCNAWGVDPAKTPSLDVRIILGDLFGTDLAGLARIEGQRVQPGLIAEAETLIERRLDGEPVARLLGEWEFWGLCFQLGPDTLVPRPDTETVVAATLEALATRGPVDRPLTVVDFGTGTGCILLALLSELPNAFGVGIDRAPGALMMARDNAHRLGLAGRTAFVCSDWADALAIRADAIVANPPYIPTEDVAGLMPEVREHDPALALDGGPDGLAAYRALIADLPRLINANGVAVIELGAGQAETVGGIASSAGLLMATRPDLLGIARAAVLTKPQQFSK